jgi:hypothetical protein
MMAEEEVPFIKAALGGEHIHAWIRCWWDTTKRTRICNRHDERRDDCLYLPYFPTDYCRNPGCQRYLQRMLNIDTNDLGGTYDGRDGFRYLDGTYAHQQERYQ